MSLTAGSNHRKLIFVLTTTLVPVAVVLGILTGAIIIWRRYLKVHKGFTTQSSLDPADSRQDITLQLADSRILESKTLNGSLMPMASGVSFTSSPSAEDIRITSAVGYDPPPAWIDNVPFSDWEIDVEDVVIGLRPDGRKYELGAGAFSRVSFLA